MANGKFGLLILKTIADFRKDNSEALKNLFKEFLKLCHKLQLISFKTVAIDGTKMRGQNSLNEVYQKKTDGTD